MDENPVKTEIRLCYFLLKPTSIQKDYLHCSLALSKGRPNLYC
jgi:hypothetical protein